MDNWILMAVGNAKARCSLLTADMRPRILRLGWLDHQLHFPFLMFHANDISSAYMLV
jgi:hypothetical protein